MSARCPAIVLAILATGAVLLSGCAASTDRAQTPDAELRRQYDALIGSAPVSPALADDVVLQRIAFGSCLHQARPQPILDAMARERWDLLLMIGDNVYGDVTAPDDLGPLLEAYALQARSEPLNALRASTPLLAVWDDHDYGLNDGGAEFPLRAQAQIAFEAFWHVDPDSRRARTPGVQDAIIVGPPGRRVQIILLDTRFFRSPLRPTDQRNAPGRERYLPQTDPAATLLGAEQWRWLESQLRQPADLRLLVSSIQVIADGHGWEAWRTMPQERARLYALIERTGAHNLVVLSGDRHRAGLYRQEQGLSAPLHEITSSALNLPIPGIEAEAGPYRLGPTYDGENFGSLVVDWEAHRVALELRDVEGEVVRRLGVPF